MSEQFVGTPVPTTYFRFTTLNPNLSLCSEKVHLSDSLPFIPKKPCRRNVRFSDKTLCYITLSEFSAARIAVGIGGGLVFLFGSGHVAVQEGIS